MSTFDKELATVLDEIKAGVQSEQERGKKIEAALTELRERLGSLEEWKRKNLPGGIVIGLSDAEKRKFSLLRWANAKAQRRPELAAFEEDVLKQTTKKWMESEEGRALSSVVDTAGGYVVPVEYLAEIIELYRAQLVLARAGIVERSFNHSPVVLPRLTAASTGDEYAENAAISATDQTFGQVTLTPHMSAVLCQASRLSIMISDPSLEAIQRDDMAKVLARRVDLLGFRGLGASNEPLGLFNQASINTVSMGAAGGPVTYDKLIDMEGELEDDDVPLERCFFVGHPKVKRKIRKIKDSDGHPILSRDSRDGNASGSVQTVLGYPIYTTTQLPTNLTEGAGSNLAELALIQPDDVIFGSWGGLLIEATTEGGNAFANHQLFIKAVKYWDIALRHQTGVCLANDVETA